MNDTALRVLLVEDSPLLAERLREALGQLAGVEIVGTADTEQSAVSMIGNSQVDVVILDLQLKVGTGFGVLQKLGTIRPIVIVLTNFALPAYQQRARELGAEHFLDKSRDYERLPGVIEALRAGLVR